MKIVVLIPYFGRIPKYADVFFWSAGKNPNLEYYLFTDSPRPANLASNIKFVPFSVSQFNQLASSKLGLNVSVLAKFSYKLCDFRPAYARIFEDYISGYDFFGYGDIDLILGDTSQFLTKERLADFDIVTMRKEYLSGSMTLIRNNEKCARLYLKSKDVEKIFSNSEVYYGFDEVGHNLLKKLKKWDDILHLDREIDSFSYIAAKCVQENTLRIDYTTKICEEITSDRVLVIDGGQIMEISPQSDKKYMYFHWVNEKHLFHFGFLRFKDLVEPLYVCRIGFLTAQQFRMKNFMVFLRRSSGWARKYLRHYPRRVVEKTLSFLRTAARNINN